MCIGASELVHYFSNKPEKYVCFEVPLETPVDLQRRENFQSAGFKSCYY